jgi:hypothetical protein
MFDRISTVPCLTAATCGGAVKLRLGYAPEYRGRRRLSLRPTVDAVHQTCSCPLSHEDIDRLGVQAWQALPTRRLGTLGR